MKKVKIVWKFDILKISSLFFIVPRMFMFLLTNSCTNCNDAEIRRCNFLYSLTHFLWQNLKLTESEIWSNSQILPAQEKCKFSTRLLLFKDFIRGKFFPIIISPVFQVLKKFYTIWVDVYLLANSSHWWVLLVQENQLFWMFSRVIG